MTSQEPFDPVAASRRILRLAATGSLATLDEGGHPYASLVTVATLPRGEPVLLLSRLAVHTRNLARDGRASLLLVAPGGEGGDPLAGGRVTLVGDVAPAPDAAQAAARFLARHPEAAGYAGFADFSYYTLRPARAHLVAGFGRIHTLAPPDVLLDAALPDLSAIEPGAVAHMNEDHADAVALYATRLLGEQPGPWRLVALDAAGLDLACGDRAARLDFPEPLRAASELRPVLVELARRARQPDATG